MQVCPRSSTRSSDSAWSRETGGPRARAPSRTYSKVAKRSSLPGDPTFSSFTLRLYYSLRLRFSAIASHNPSRLSRQPLVVVVVSSAETLGLASNSRLLPPEVERVEAVDKGLGSLRARRPHLVCLLHELEEGLHLPLVGDGPGALRNLLPVLQSRAGDKAKGEGFFELVSSPVVLSQERRSTRVRERESVCACVWTHPPGARGIPCDADLPAPPSTAAPS